MTIRKIKVPKPRKAKVGSGKYDIQLSAILFHLWRTGQLKNYPLDIEQYPDNEDTASKLGCELLKMKLRCECSTLQGFQNMVRK